MNHEALLVLISNLSAQIFELQERLAALARENAALKGKEK